MTMDRILPPGGLGPKQEPLRREREPVKVKQDSQSKYKVVE